MDRSKSSLREVLLYIKYPKGKKKLQGLLDTDGDQKAFLIRQSLSQRSFQMRGDDQEMSVDGDLGGSYSWHELIRSDIKLIM